MEHRESEQLEFKLRIDLPRKIAKTLVAFANSSGGRIVVGVRDHGAVAGCEPEEEFHMLEAASARHTKPIVGFTAQPALWDHKKVLVVDVPASQNGPHYAHDGDQDRWLAYVRRGAANYVANRVLCMYVADRYTEGAAATAEQLGLLHFFGPSHTRAAALARRSGLPIREVEEGLAVLLRWGLIDASPEEHGWSYRLAP